MAAGMKNAKFMNDRIAGVSQVFMIGSLNHDQIVGRIVSSQKS